MRVPTLPYHIPLQQLRREVVYTLARAKRRDHVKALIDPLKSQLDVINQAIAKETALIDAVEHARAEVDDVDEQLDGIFEETAAQAKLAVGNVLSDPLWQSLFGSRRPSEWMRLRLGEELEQVRSWPGKLKGAAAAGLRDLVPEIEACLLLCDAAAKSEQTAVTAYETWRLGARVGLVDKVNALRKQLAGEVEAHAHTTRGSREQGLGLFRLTTTKRGARQTSIDNLKAELAAAKQQVSELEAQLLAAQKQAEEEAQIEAERLVAEAKLAELENARSETERHIAELRKKLGGAKK